ncbi:hypothetical protein HNP29_005681 [Pseudomonas alcaligenes]|nr:hypothetical protein [Pseudomonas alcaligenes]
MPSKQVNEELSTFIHDLFLYNEYKEWRKGLKSVSEGKWHSLVAGLSRFGAPTDRALGLGEDICSNLVFNYTKAPDYRESQMLMVQFTVAGSMWHSLVWHCPERN